MSVRKLTPEESATYFRRVFGSGAVILGGQIPKDYKERLARQKEKAEQKAQEQDSKKE